MGLERFAFKKISVGPSLPVADLNNDNVLAGIDMDKLAVTADGGVITPSFAKPPKIAVLEPSWRQPIHQRLNVNREIPALLGAAFVDDAS